MTTDGTIINNTAAGGFYLYSLNITGNVGIVGSVTTVLSQSLVVASGKTLDIGPQTTLTLYKPPTGILINNGIIGGYGIFKIMSSGTWASNISFGNVQADVFISNDGPSGAEVLTATGNAALGGCLYIWSTDAGYTLTLDLSTSNYRLSAASITLGVAAVLNGRGSIIYCDNFWRSTVGTFIQGTSRLYVNDTTTIKATQQMTLTRGAYSLSLTPSSMATISHFSVYGDVVWQPSTVSTKFSVVPSDVIVGIGDSRMPSTYTDQLRALTGATVYNEGVGGQTSTQILARFAADALSHSPDYIVINAGTNDYAGGTLIFPSITESNLGAMFNATIAAGAKVIVFTVMPYATWIPHSQTKWSEVNAWIRTQASANIAVIDAAELMAGPVDPQVLNPIYDDGSNIHANLAGNYYLANVTYLQVFQPYAQLVHSPQTSSASFDVVSNVTPSFNVSGLESGMIYRVSHDGVVFVTAAGPSLSFIVIGDGTYIIIAPYSSSVSNLLILIPFFLTLGVLMIPVNYIIKQTKTKKPIRVDEVIRMFVTIVVGMALVGITYVMI
jgi:lysophospholipase L1-like esterase